MKILQISAGRERSVVLAAGGGGRAGTAYALGSVKRLGATLPPGYPGELCTSSPTEIGHNRFAQPVAQVLNPDAPFVAIADGFADTLAVRADGAVLSCQPVVSPDQGARLSQVVGLPLVVQVGQTESAGFARDAGGAVWSWGMAGLGQLGRNSSERIATPGLVTGVGRIRQLACGQGHVLALDRSGQVWAWGANGAGQLGVGHLKASTQPVKLKLAARMVHVAAGDTHSLAIDEAGRLWAWGSNNFGQLGELAGTQEAPRYTTLPQRIKTGFQVALADAGMFYTVATSRQGDVFAWGWNAMGQLAQSGFTHSPKPQRIASLTQVTQLSAGQGHVLAANDAGVFAWGDNRASACGAFPSVTVQATPVRITFA